MERNRIKGSRRKRLITHGKEACEGRTCSIHHPSNHPMKKFKQVWRSDAGFMERVCPHGVGHPDPDDLTYRMRRVSFNLLNTLGVHGCDGCCAGSYTDAAEAHEERKKSDQVRDEEEI